MPVVAALLLLAPADLLAGGDWTPLDPARAVRTFEGATAILDVKDPQGRPAYDTQHRKTVSVPLKTGEVLAFTFEAKGAPGTKLSAFVQNVEDGWVDHLRREVALTGDWTTYRVTGVMNADRAAGRTQAGFDLGYAPGRIEIRNVSLARLDLGDRQTGPVVPLVAPFQTPGGTTVTEEGGNTKLVFPAGDPSKPWLVGLRRTSTGLVVPGDAVVLRAKMRSRTSSKIAVNFERDGEPYTKVFTQQVALTPEWKEVAVGGIAGETYGPGDAALSIFLGYGAGEAEIKEFSLTNVGPKTMQDLNLPVDYYGSMKPDDAWRAPALARIERFRKGDLVVNATKNGKPFPGAVVRVEQVSQAFRFGTAAPAVMIAGDGPDADRFREVLKKNFNTVTFENDLKWNDLESTASPELAKAWGWLDANGFRVRGHNVVWGSKQFLPRGLWEKSDDEIRATIRERVNRSVVRYRGRPYLWDVVNEASVEKDLWERIGWKEFYDVFRQARAADPEALLAYNDYNITEENAAGDGQRKRVIELVKELDRAGAPLDVIGVQCHVGVPLTPVGRVVEIMQDMAKLGKRLEVTEFDAGLWDDAFYGKYLKDYMTAMYSIPEVDAFILWGFWEGAHWRAKEGGHLYRRDWTPRAPAVAWNALVRKTWWTNLTGKTDAKGRWQGRAFFGRVRITVNAGGETTVREVDVLPQKPTVVGL